MTRLKVAMHVHSEWSFDAHWPLSQIAQSFARRGYDAVMLCDHHQGFDQESWESYQQACVNTSSDRLLLIPGIEYADPDNLIHIAVWGAPLLGHGLSAREVVRSAHELQGFALLAHPSRRLAFGKVDREILDLCGGIEAWNRKYDGWTPSEDARRLLQSAEHCTPVVSLDFHRRRQFFPLAMQIEVVGPSSVHAVIDQFRLGRAAARAFRCSLSSFAAEPLSRISKISERARKTAAWAVRLPAWAADKIKVPAGDQAN
jgi:hypothetical protein